MYFFNTKRQGVAIAGADIEDVAIESSPGTPALSDPTRLQDLSYVAP